MQNAPVIVIEDDENDTILLRDVFKELNYPNKVLFFTDGQSALDFLNGEGSAIIPFIILSDINLPKVDGFQLRDKIKMDANLQLKCIPYLFFSTHVTRESVIDAYTHSVQGFFVKQNSFDELAESISVIMEYWKRCVSPNNFLHNDGAKDMKPR